MAGIIFGSVLVGLFTSYIQYSGLFQKALAKIVYERRFVERLKVEEIETIWKDISEILFESRFPDIRSEMLETIRGSYLSGSDPFMFYLEDMEIKLIIKWCDKKRRIIEIEQQEKLRLRARDKSPFVYSNLYTAIKSYDDPDIPPFEITSYKINGHNFMDRLERKEKVMNDVRLHYMNVPLVGKDTYDIKRSYIKRQNILRDPIIGFTARTMINKLTMELFNEIKKDVHTCFMGRGNIPPFQEEEKLHSLEYRFDKLLLRKHGFLVTVNLK